jgi:hypothetical protein
MIVIKLQGGLGNQMFQYATGRSLSNKLNSDLYLDVSFFDKTTDPCRKFELDTFDLNINIATSRQVNKFFKKSPFNRIKQKLGFQYPTVFKEKKYFFDPDVFDITPPVFVSGFFQSEKYFEAFKCHVKEDFKFPAFSDSYHQKVLDDIKSVNSVAIHVRRTDYVTSQSTNAFHGTCSLSYYLNAIETLSRQIRIDKFFIFSDDSAWVEKNLILDERFNVVRTSVDESWIDMCLMSKCKHNIIANSSYSWWAAYLNDNTEKVVVAPKKWLQITEFDTSVIIPKEWITI